MIATQLPRKVVLVMACQYLPPRPTDLAALLLDLRRRGDRIVGAAIKLIGVLGEVVEALVVDERDEVVVWNGRNCGGCMCELE